MKRKVPTGKAFSQASSPLGSYQISGFGTHMETSPLLSRSTAGQAERGQRHHLNGLLHRLPLFAGDTASSGGGSRGLESAVPRSSRAFGSHFFVGPRHGPRHTGGSSAGKVCTSCQSRSFARCTEIEKLHASPSPVDCWPEWSVPSPCGSGNFDTPAKRASAE